MILYIYIYSVQRPLFAMDMGEKKLKYICTPPQIHTSLNTYTHFLQRNLQAIMWLPCNVCARTMLQLLQAELNPNRVAAWTLLFCCASCELSRGHAWRESQRYRALGFDVWPNFMKSRCLLRWTLALGRARLDFLVALANHGA